MAENTPLSMKLRSSADAPRAVEGVEDSLSVDTSDEFDDYSDHDVEKASEQNGSKPDVIDF
jgi:hypothetical protein